tara:strand:+ start:2143 stop:3291 length:1149 start_codon:yes stop_codon:yes gene_type:complete
MPILKILHSKKFEIYFYYNNDNCFNLVTSNNKIFREIKKIAKFSYVQKKYDFLIYKLLRKIFNFLKLKKFELILSKKIHSFIKLLNKLKIKDFKKILFVFSEYGNLNYTLELLSKIKKKERPFIVQYPAGPTINPDNDKRIQKTLKGKMRRLSIFADLILINSKKSLSYWNLYIRKKDSKIKEVGMPLFDKNFLKKKIIKRGKKKILLTLNDIEIDKLLPGEIEEFQKYLNGFFDNLKNFADANVVLKLHPNKPLNIQKYLIKKYDYKVSKGNMLDEIVDTTILITQFKTSASIYGPLYNIPTLSWPNIFKGAYSEIKDPYAELGLTYECKDFDDFIQKYKLAFYQSNSLTWRNQQKKISEHFNLKESPTQKVLFELEKFYK